VKCETLCRHLDRPRSMTFLKIWLLGTNNWLHNRCHRKSILPFSVSLFRTPLHAESGDNTWWLLFVRKCFCKNPARRNTHDLMEAAILTSSVGLIRIVYFYAFCQKHFKFPHCKKTGNVVFTLLNQFECLSFKRVES